MQKTRREHPEQLRWLRIFVIVTFLIPIGGIVLWTAVVLAARLIQSLT